MRRKRVLITGSGSGLGKEAAILLARRGHFVIATVQYSEQMKKLTELAKEEKLALTVFQTDILKEEDKKKIAKQEFDVLILNAAIGESGSVCEVPLEKIRVVFETNLYANLLLAQQVFAKWQKERKRGRILFLTSMAGRIPLPFLSPYCASKAALESFVICFREEIKLIKDCQIEVGMIEPGSYATGFNYENNQKMYEWMDENSYFYPILPELREKQQLWSMMEVKDFHSAVKQYVKAVEDKKLKLRYCAPWYQAAFVQLGRMLGM